MIGYGLLTIDKDSFRSIGIPMLPAKTLADAIKLLPGYQAPLSPQQGAAYFSWFSCQLKFAGNRFIEFVLKAFRLCAANKSHTNVLKKKQRAKRIRFVSKW